MARRRPRKGPDEEEHVNHERWLVSYSDMLTVLLGLFIVLYAMSQVDQAKYEALRASLSAGFGHESILVGETGVLDETDDVSSGAIEGISDVYSPVEPIDDLVVPDPQEALRAAAEAEVDRLEGVRQAIADRLSAAGLGSAVQMRITERGLVIGLVADDVFFAPASAELTVTARAVLDTIAPVLVAIDDEVAIEGHANVLPVSGRYATNWELSADRATQVLRRFVEGGGLPAGRVLAVGFGDARPIASGGDPAALAMNRRVDVVVLSSAPEQVRAFVPSVLGE